MNALRCGVEPILIPTASASSVRQLLEQNADCQAQLEWEYAFKEVVLFILQWPLQLKEAGVSGSSGPTALPLVGQDCNIEAETATHQCTYTR